MIKRKGKNKYAGFSFIEVMLSVAVLSIGIAGVFPLIISGLKETLDSRDQVIASMLAQEGAELVQNIRDNNWADGNDAFDNPSFPTSSLSNCRVDYNDTDEGNMSCNNANGSKELKLNANNFYTHSAGTATKFQRKIEIAYDTGNANTANQAIITSVVIWSESGAAFPTIANCNTINKCAYEKVTLTTWYEN